MFLHQLVEKKNAVCFLVREEMPTILRPLYELLLTGVAAETSGGITSIEVVRLSTEKGRTDPADSV
mgnify:CR=1 FL=1